MRKIFFVVSNYNTNPFTLTALADDYQVFDQSDDLHWKAFVLEAGDPKVRFTQNSGTSLINYLTYIVENYDSLPSTVAFLKGNVVGRHISQDRFEELIKNRHYTYIWDEPYSPSRSKTVIRPQNNNYLELNNSWYVGLSSHRYFIGFDEFMQHFFQDYTPTRYVNFCPGANFIVESSRILQHPKGLYLALLQILEYGFFPSEAWMVERAFNLIFAGDLKAREEFRLPAESIRARVDSLPDLTSLFVPPPGPLAGIKKLQNKLTRSLSKLPGLD